MSKVAHAAESVGKGVLDVGKEAASGLVDVVKGAAPALINAAANAAVNAAGNRIGMAGRFVSESDRFIWEARKVTYTLFPSPIRCHHADDLLSAAAVLAFSLPYELSDAGAFQTLPDGVKEVLHEAEEIVAVNVIKYHEELDFVFMGKSEVCFSLSKLPGGIVSLTKTSSSTIMGMATMGEVMRLEVPRGSSLSVFFTRFAKSVDARGVQRTGQLTQSERILYYQFLVANELMSDELEKFMIPNEDKQMLSTACFTIGRAIKCVGEEASKLVGLRVPNRVIGRIDESSVTLAELLNIHATLHIAFAETLGTVEDVRLIAGDGESDDADSATDTLSRYVDDIKGGKMDLMKAVGEAE